MQFTIVVKHTHYYQHKIEADNKEEAIRKLHEEEPESDPVNVDHYYGDWQELAEGEIVSVVENGGGS